MCPQESRAATSSSVKVRLTFPNRQSWSIESGRRLLLFALATWLLKKVRFRRSAHRFCSIWLHGSARRRNKRVKSMIARLIYVELKILNPHSSIISSSLIDVLRPSLLSKQPVRMCRFTRTKPLDCDHGDVLLHILPLHHLIWEYKGIVWLTYLETTRKYGERVSWLQFKCYLYYSSKSPCATPPFLPLLPPTPLCSVRVISASSTSPPRIRASSPSRVILFEIAFYVVCLLKGTMAARVKGVFAVFILVTRHWVGEVIQHRN